ncbi:MAG TPA: putative lipid II flippase FtsW [Candidatus Dormibacteraeota bacterium]|jgi:cell division protein FtsW|nr:putative lipid II flippase FtsW [Candidatus Dormibacteraeota bacterium]
MATRTRTLGGTAPRTLSRRDRRTQVQEATVDEFRPSRTRGLAWLSARETASTLSRVDGWLMATLVGLCAFGLVMVYSASEALGYAWFGNPNYFFEHQLVWLVGGVVAWFVATNLDYHKWHRFSRPLAIATVVLLIAVLVPHIGTEKLGARRWFAVGPLSVQPSAVATLVAIVWFSRWLVDRGPVLRRFAVVWQFGFLLGALLILIVLERDLGSAIILACIGVALLALSGARIHHVVFVLGVLVALGYLAVTMEAYRANRLSSFRDPFADPLNAGFQSVQSLIALGSGGFTGVGLGNSIQKYQWLPEAHSDFIFAIIGEELGLIGGLVVIGGYLMFAWRGVRTSLRAPDRFGSVLAGGITAWISIQAFVNIGAVTGVIPTTGITLPFISYGGSSLFMSLLAVGVLCNISAQGRRQGEARRAHVDRWRGDGRPPDPRDGRRPSPSRV